MSCNCASCKWWRLIRKAAKLAYKLPNWATAGVSVDKEKYQ